MIKGILFDMDGVISDTQKKHSEMESKLFSKYGVDIDPKVIVRNYSGVKVEELFENLLKKSTKEYNLEEVVSNYWAEMIEIAKVSVPPIPGAIDLIKYFHENNFKLALVSSSEFKFVETVLKTLDVYDYFSIIISGDMVEKGKPNPECFLLGANKLNLKPSECVVIEDSSAGMQAAKDGNIKCIGLVSNINEEYPTKNLVTSLNEINKDYLLNLK